MLVRVHFALSVPVLLATAASASPLCHCFPTNEPSTLTRTVTVTETSWRLSSTVVFTPTTTTTVITPTTTIQISSPRARTSSSFRVTATTKASTRSVSPTSASPIRSSTSLFMSSSMPTLATVSTLSITATATSPTRSHPHLPHRSSSTSPSHSPSAMTPVYPTSSPRLNSSTVPASGPSVVTFTVTADCSDAAHSNTGVLDSPSENGTNRNGSANTTGDSNQNNDSNGNVDSNLGNGLNDDSNINGSANKTGNGDLNDADRSNGNSNLNGNNGSNANSNYSTASLPGSSSANSNGHLELCCNHKGEADSLIITLLAETAGVDLSGMTGLVGIVCTAIGEGGIFDASKCGGSILLCAGLATDGVGYDCLL